ncbi:hypothetical protein N8301_06080 [Cyclobacteriaceae bacterium]|nr:hypothetical protein [Cyclobacteriaceae bacterium]
MSEIFTPFKFSVLIKSILLLFCCALLNSSFGQTEKRLALVIGNANYVKGELKNPVNEDGLNFEEELVVNLYRNDTDLYFERKNHLFRLLLNSDLISVIDEYSSNFNISKETIRTLLYELNVEY